MVKQRSQKRSQKRSHLTYYLDVIDTETGTKIGKIADITVDGLMLLSQTMIKVGVEKNLKITSSDNYFEPIVFTSDCRWCRVDVNPDYYDIGFHMDHISEYDKEKINDLISDSFFAQ